MTARAFVLVLALTVSGCHRMGWWRPGATLPTLMADKSWCATQFSLLPEEPPYGRPLVNPYLPRRSESDPDKRRQDFMNRCMGERGWQLMELPNKAPVPPPDDDS